MKIKYLSWKQKHLKHGESSWKYLRSSVSVQVIEGVGQNSIGEEERKNNLGTFFSVPCLLPTASKMTLSRGGGENPARSVPRLPCTALHLHLTPAH